MHELEVSHFGNDTGELVIGAGEVSEESYMKISDV